jgi:hypothetical protein
MHEGAKTRNCDKPQRTQGAQRTQRGPEWDRMLALSESPLTFGCFVFFVLFVSFVLIYLCRFAFSLFRPFAF